MLATPPLMLSLSVRSPARLDCGISKYSTDCAPIGKNPFEGNEGSNMLPAVGAVLSTPTEVQKLTKEEGSQRSRTEFF